MQFNQKKVSLGKPQMSTKLKHNVEPRSVDLNRSSRIIHKRVENGQKSNKKNRNNQPKLETRIVGIVYEKKKSETPRIFLKI